MVKTATIRLRMGNSRERVDFVVVRRLAVPILLLTSYIDMILQGIFPLEPNIVAYSSRPVPILAINDLPKEIKIGEKDKTQDVSIS